MKTTKLILCLLLALSLLLAACETTPAAPRSTESKTEPAQSEAPNGPGPADWSSLSGKGKVGTVLPDFSLDTADGGVFTLSEVLKDHELVFINLWATWCGPCQREFPFLEAAYQANRDRVAVIAVSVEERDTPEVLRKYAEENRLSFPLAQDRDYALLGTFNVSAIPTSLLVDRSRTVLWMETGAKDSEQAFTELFNTYLNSGESGANQKRYEVTILDQNGAPVPGCAVNFCTEESCVPMVSDETGRVCYYADPYAYRVQLLSVPEGYDYTGSDALFMKAEGDQMTITVTKLG